MRRLLLLVALIAAPAVAGPPYVTDDPQPTDFGHYEVYFFASAAHVPGATTGASGVDFNYGGFRDIQLTAVVPVAFDTSGGGRRVGAGNVEVAVKYKFLHQTAAGIDFSVFPRVFVPTGGSRFGTGRVAVLLPLWAERDIGKWSVFGGGGYQLIPGERDFWTGGVAVSRALGDRASLGVEVYHHGPDARDARPFTGVSVGGTYRLSPHWSIIAAGGPGIENARREGQVTGYAAVKADF